MDIREHAAKEAAIRHRQRGDWQYRNGRRPTGRWGHVYAALDLGTNNCRLLIARPAERGFRVIDAFSRIVRLGEGVMHNGRLSEAAIDRTVDALKVCAEKMGRRGVTKVRSIATAACRIAENRDSFVSRVKADTGVSLDVISTSEEARLAVVGCSSLFDRAADHALVFDIGGGSTELIWVKVNGGRLPEIIAWTSLPCGVVNLAERFDGRHVPPETYENMIAYVERQLALFESEYCLGDLLAQGRVQMLGTSGTVTTLAGLYLELERYERSKVDGLWIDMDDLKRLSRAVSGMALEERAASPCIGPERADLVIGGCAILEAICRTWPCERLRVADRGLREGILLGLMDEADREIPSA